MLCAHEGGNPSPPVLIAIGALAATSAKHLPLPNNNDAYKSLHVLTLLSTLVRTALMLAVAPKPRGYGASVAAVQSFGQHV
jgi:hypothetical protein